ncbi:MAG: hypothetical protein ACSLFN_00265 [Candidatus Limnocylindrales bacterium]
MDEQTVRDRAEELCAAFVSGDMGRALELFSPELRQHVGEVVSLLPLPMSEATVESIEHSGAGDNVVLRMVGETAEDLFQTRWKDRDGTPTLIELSHLSKTEREPAADDGDGDLVDGAAEAGEPG